MEQEIARFFSRNQYFQTASIGQKVTTDIVGTANTFRFSLKVAVWGDTSQKKLCVYGGLPFQVAKATHSLPIQIWLTSSYPVEPPTCFVVPSADNHKIVAGHRAVDGTGMCYAPALAQWNPATSTLKTLLIQFVKMFSQQPPLYVDEATPAAGSGLGKTPSGSPASGGASGEAAAAAGLATKDGEAPDEDSTLCVVCLSDAKDTVLVPCGHFCSCNSCAGTLTACPLCRTAIQYRQRVFV